MFSSILACLFVSKITQKNYSTNFHKIDWKGGTWATKIDSAGDPNHVMLSSDSVRPRQTHKILYMGES